MEGKGEGTALQACPSGPEAICKNETIVREEIL